MRNSKLATAVLVFGLAALLGVTVSSDAQIKKGKTRLMQTKHLMKGVMKEHCGALKKGLDAGPSKDADWEDLELHAALLNEASYILLDDGRCPDATWAEAASKTLRQGSADVLKAVGAKDAEAAKKAFGGLTGACEACHKAHKKSS